ncbi:uncharacterized protein BJ212DRAFT_1301417 [Suillus subaureus]|uniref:Ricin B lectin domain-containing protein n=1 Tax=Suillus subaureus TaxID=48587 RepID=A0A9P7E7A6_9AGAM|nr:uncharacterized protein BJ212DRAFT_1301417 [Suillus subaureus]KAG1812971.1 hypothetical protein BJ212DRAFT_1301417 [Suillus subaureus]
MQPGIYKFINRQSGTAMDLAKDDYAHVVGSPPCDDFIQKWEVAPLGAGYTIRNIQTGTYISVRGGVHGGAAVSAGLFPTAWQLNTVKVDDENAKMIELWKPVFIQHIYHSALPERAGEDDETSSTTTIDAADVPEGGELVLVTTTTTRTVVTKVPKPWSKGPRA